MSNVTPPPREPLDNQLALPLAAIVCIAVAGYVLLLVIIIIIKNMLVSRGVCTCATSCEEGKCCGQCCTCCSMAEVCSCPSPNVNSCVNVICPKKKKARRYWKSMGCMDMILCHCCTSDEAIPNICSCFELNCDFNFTYINCCCFRVHLGQTDPWATSMEPWLNKSNYTLSDYTKNAVAQNSARSNSSELSERNNPKIFEVASSRSQVPSIILSDRPSSLPRMDTMTTTCLTLQEITSHTSVVTTKKSHRIESEGADAKRYTLTVTELEQSRSERSTYRPIRPKSLNITNPYSPRAKSSTNPYSSPSKTSIITNPYSPRPGVGSNTSLSGNKKNKLQSASPHSISRGLPVHTLFKK